MCPIYCTISRSVSTPKIDFFRWWDRHFLQTPPQLPQPPLAVSASMHWKRARISVEHCPSLMTAFTSPHSSEVGHTWIFSIHEKVFIIIRNLIGRMLSTVMLYASMPSTKALMQVSTTATWDSQGSGSSPSSWRSSTWSLKELLFFLDLSWQEGNVWMLCEQNIHKRRTTMHLKQEWIETTHLNRRKSAWNGAEQSQGERKEHG